MIFGIKVNLSIISLYELILWNSTGRTLSTSRTRNLYCSVLIPDALIYGFLLNKFEISHLLYRLINNIYIEYCSLLLRLEYALSDSVLCRVRFFHYFMGLKVTLVEN